MKRSPSLALLLSLGLVAPMASAYPLDGYLGTRISRLVAYRLASQGSHRPAFIKDGALLRSDQIRLNLADDRSFRLPAPDPALSSRLKAMLGGDASAYGVTLLDFSDPQHPRYAVHNENQAQAPGSVGKILVALAFFQTLADIYPDDIQARRRLLYETEIVANGFIGDDEHLVPFWQYGDPKVENRPIVRGDRANLWTFLDWMCSASSNAAAAMIQSQLILLKHFGRDYPVSEAQAAAFFKNTPKSELSRIFIDATETPARRAGLDLDRLRKTSFFTGAGKARVPGAYSTSTAGELMHYVILMEQGKLVDRFSSLEIKKLLYLTDNRIRFASQPALDSSAIYFKSGSLYSCKPEKGFACDKFLGNRLNFMNSMVLVETQSRNPVLRYVVVVLSNVLRKNSAEVHVNLATQIHHAIEAMHPESGLAQPAATSVSP